MIKLKKFCKSTKSLDPDQTPEIGKSLLLLTFYWAYGVQSVVGDCTTLSDSIKIRLREGQALVYAAQAEQRGVGVAAHIRDRLDHTDRIEDELVSIRAGMIELGKTMDKLRDEVAERSLALTQEMHFTGKPSAMEIETLLLLRVLSTPQKLQMVTAEIERQGLEPFQIPRAPTRSR